MKFAAGALALSLIAAAGAARAQEADPIGALLRQAEAGQIAPTDEDAAEILGRPVVPQADAAAGLPVSPIPYGRAMAPPSHLTEPVTLDERGRTPDSPPSVSDLAYESRLRSSFASAQGFQGPLDGSFVLSVGGRDLYALELVDRSRGALEGAWRDLSSPGASGFVDELRRAADGAVTLVFGGVQATLRGGANAQWTGQVDGAGGRSQPAVLRRVTR